LDRQPVWPRAAHVSLTAWASWRPAGGRGTTRSAAQRVGGRLSGRSCETRSDATVPDMRLPGRRGSLHHAVGYADAAPGVPGTRVRRSGGSARANSTRPTRSPTCGGAVTRQRPKAGARRIAVLTRLNSAFQPRSCSTVRVAASVCTRAPWHCWCSVRTTGAGVPMLAGVSRSSHRKVCRAACSVDAPPAGQVALFANQEHPMASPEILTSAGVALRVHRLSIRDCPGQTTSAYILAARAGQE